MARLIVPTVSPVAVARSIAVLLWALALHNTLTCRGLFWDGASFLVNLLDHGHFHDFYAARAHVDWVTQAPVLLLAGEQDPVTPPSFAFALARNNPQFASVEVVAGANHFNIMRLGGRRHVDEFLQTLGRPQGGRDESASHAVHQTPAAAVDDG